MALTRRDTAIAGIASFVAWGFVTHWLPVLRYIGYAFITGISVAIFAIAAFILLSTRNRREFLDNEIKLTATPAFVATGAWDENTAWLFKNSIYKRRPIYPSSFVISDCIDGLLDFVLRDFVTSWYGNITNNPRFVNEIDRATRAALVSVLQRITSLDLIEVAVSRLVPIFTAHLKEFAEAERVVRGKHLNRNVTESEELDLAIAGKYKDGKLHQAASLAFSDTKLAQQDYLRKIVVRLMPEILPESMIRSRAVSVLIKEIVSCAVLFPVLQLLSDPDVWNQLLGAYGQVMLQDRKSVRKLRAALDEHASPAPKPPRTLIFPRLSPHDDERKFERFIRAIRQCNNLSDARRFRSEVASQLKRELITEGQDHIYLRRLETGKRILDQRVGKLSAVGGASATPINQPDFGNSHLPSRKSNSSIREVLQDASGLSYFMEYMDRQRLMTLVQFWIVVEGFRNPLEDDLLEDGKVSGAPPQWTDSDRLDLAQITEAYLSKPELDVPEESRADVKAFLRAGRSATPLQYIRARGAVLRAQSAVLERMQDKHFPGFKNSDLYYKYLTSDDSSTKAVARTVPRTLKAPPIIPTSETFQKPIPPNQPSSRPISRMNTGRADLRRNATSSSDLRSSHKANEEPLQEQRRSFDINPSAPLFDDDIDNEPLARSSYSIENESLNGDQLNGSQEQMVEAMEAALNNIMTNQSQEEDPKNSSFENIEPDSMFGQEVESQQASTPSTKSESIFQGKKRERPNLTSLGLVNAAGRIGVFTDNDLFGDEEKFIEDEHADPEEAGDKPTPEDEIHLAAPGDLGLAEAISALTVDIEKLVAQESIVDTLTRKAELTNNVAELRILGKSKLSLQREIRRKELQRQQYIVQESDNSLYGRANIDIKSLMVGREEDGQEFAVYVIEVHRIAGENMSAASWAVARRYSEFHDLHQRLRSIYPAVRHLDFPRRRLVMKLQKEFLHKRRVSLEHYLRELLRMPAVCRSRDLRAFLSQQAIISTTPNTDRSGERQDIVSRIYNSVTDGMDEFLGNVPVLDQLSIAGQNLISAATSQFNTLPSTSNTSGVGAVNAEDGISISDVEAQAELNAFENKELEPFVKPICDIFLEVFELNRGNNWLRGRAAVVVLHQLLGGTVERKVRENAKSLMQEESVLRYISLLKDTTWPNGQLKRDIKPRTEAEMSKSRREASVMLATLIPDLAGNVVGRTNAQVAGRKLFASLNNQRLNAHLAFTLLDEVVGVLFPGGRGRGR